MRESDMRKSHNYQFVAQAALIGVMLAAVDLSLYEALRHMLR
jgi:hypothetical protein